MSTITEEGSQDLHTRTIRKPGQHSGLRKHHGNYLRGFTSPSRQVV
ncbi:hypothetical protein [Pigmentiphaga aceris]|nr:hypothetical protein [Pigmentiphaga aceris]